MKSNYSKMKFAFESIRLQSILSSAFILITLFVAVLQFEELRSICVCISNYLVWSWIAFGIAIFIGLLTRFLILSVTNNYKLCNMFLALQSISFFLGIVFAVLFGSLLLKVL
ncbi:MAG: hypothetical protein U9R19_14945 [Bacteroidota bacterium]|nr:hypothetical protein [Bacteroidota bacterium]